ncbi:MAG: hypothetical protein IPK82_40110 [Polyangiaceae bacterium]|nr:hypothetical protein [Polyangiaceae bacterium]
MIRPLIVASIAVVFGTSCTAAFKDRRTPSGDFCSDMAVIPAGEEPDLEYHRLQPVQSDIKARTEAERLESLRKAACLVGGDAVIEAVNEEVRNEQAQYVLVSSGTAVIWVRPKTGEVKPLTTHKKPKKKAQMLRRLSRQQQSLLLLRRPRPLPLPQPRRPLRPRLRQQRLPPRCPLLRQPQHQQLLPQQPPSPSQNCPPIPRRNRFNPKRSKALRRPVRASRLHSQKGNFGRPAMT